jgi:hypothetical protein
MSIADSTIHRIYSCTNEDCKCQVAFKELVKDKWRKKCPFCKKHSLVLDRASVTLSTFVDNNVAKTMGMASQQNTARREKENPLPKKEIPFWRQKEKINFNVLKNPQKYIATGQT